MNPARSVMQNSLWMGVQPVVLNIISLFVIGYIADALGNEDYGRFIFAFSIVGLLEAFSSLGLRAVVVRDIAANRENVASLIGKFLPFRAVLSCFAYFLLMMLANVMGYPTKTKTVVYIAGATLFFNAIATTFFDLFQAFEKMKYVAYARFISGAVLTALSVVVVYMGYGIFGLTIVYLLGSVLLFFFAMVYYYRNAFPPIIFSLSLPFWRESLKKGMPFFMIAFLGVLNDKIGIVFLSKMGGESSVGLYGAAIGLVSKLHVIPDSICSSIFPIISMLYSRSNEEVRNLFWKFFKYLSLIALPIAVGTTYLSGSIINLVYGEKYAASSVTLAILAWTLPVAFLDYLHGWALAAIHLQDKVLKVVSIGVIVNIFLNLLLVPFIQEVGVAFALLGSGLVTALLTFRLAYKHFSIGFYSGTLFKIIGANLILGLSVVLLKDFNLFVAIIIPGFFYFVCLILLGVVTVEDLDLLKATFSRKDPALTG